MPVHDTPAPFGAHVSLLQFFIAQRALIVERIQGTLNTQEKPAHIRQDRITLSRLFEDCFFTSSGIGDQALLRGQLQQAHWDDGFQPRVMPGVPNEMFDPADMMIRAFTVWQHTRWPGRNGRVRYAQTLFNLYIVRALALLDMRVCDDCEQAPARLAQLQSVLDSLWHSSPADQPALVRDVRWLVPVAQSPTTDALAPYFEAARRFEACLGDADRLEIHKASVLMAGGHLRSQLRHFTMQGRSLDEKDLTLSTRRSNALDCAMTIQHLVPLLQAFAQAIETGDTERRRTLAGVVCQGISSDPELFVSHPDLLGAYSMIENLFVATDESGHTALTPVGRRHLQCVQDYTSLITRLARPLHEDCIALRPVAGSYSPYGVMYGFSSNILEHMTLKALQPDAETRFSLEDVFTDLGPGRERLRWVSGWRQLPHVPPDVLKLYEYPQSFAEEIFRRIEVALRDRTDDRRGAGQRGHLVLGTGDSVHSDGIDLPIEHVLSSDPQMIQAGRASPADASGLLADRNEGMHLVSYQTKAGWIAISKHVLELVAAGRTVRTADLPRQARETMQLLYPSWVA